MMIEGKTAETFVCGINVSWFYGFFALRLQQSLFFHTFPPFDNIERSNVYQI